MSHLFWIIGGFGAASIIPISVYVWYSSREIIEEPTSIVKNTKNIIEIESPKIAKKIQEKNKDEHIKVLETQDITTSNSTYSNVPTNGKSNVNRKDLIGTAKPGSVGNKFKNYLIGTRDDVLWSKKLNIWKQLSKDPKHKVFLTTHFNPKGSEELTEDLLQSKCRLAYVKRKWDIFTQRNQSIMNEWYWDTVYSLCGQDKHRPWEWGKGSLN